MRDELKRIIHKLHSYKECKFFSAKVLKQEKFAIVLYKLQTNKIFDIQLTSIDKAIFVCMLERKMTNPLIT